MHRFSQMSRSNLKIPFATRVTRSKVHTEYLHTYLLTPWSKVLLGKLTGFQLVKKFPAF